MESLCGKARKNKVLIGGSFRLPSPRTKNGFLFYLDCPEILEALLESGDLDPPRWGLETAISENRIDSAAILYNHGVHAIERDGSTMTLISYDLRFAELARMVHITRIADDIPQYWTYTDTLENVDDPPSSYEDMPKIPFKLRETANEEREIVKQTCFTFARILHDRLGKDSPAHGVIDDSIVRHVVNLVIFPENTLELIGDVVESF